MAEDHLPHAEVGRTDMGEFNAMIYSHDMNKSGHGGEFINNTNYDRGPLPQMPSYIRIVETYIRPSAVVFGIISNLLMFLLIMHSKLRKVAPMNYIAAMALVDTGYLGANLFPWVQAHFEFDIYFKVGMCQLVNYCLKVFTFLSVWYMTTFSFERLIWEFLPERRSDLCSVFKTKLVLLAVGVISIYCHVYVCWFWEVSSDTRNMCIVHQDNIQTFQTLLKIDMVFVFLLPYSLVVIIAITVIVRKVHCRREHIDTGRPTLGRNGRLQIIDNREDRARHMHATGIFVTLAASMVLLTVPTNMVIFLHLLEIAVPLWTICLSGLFYLYWAIKPVIYLIVSARTRYCAKQLIRRLISRAAKREETRANSSNITLQEFSVGDCSEGTLVAVV